MVKIAAMFFNAHFKRLEHNYNGTLNTGTARYKNVERGSYNGLVKRTARRSGVC